MEWFDEETEEEESSSLDTSSDFSMHDEIDLILPNFM
jgi:hypothetical protein